jgi:hypothetical protein
VADGSGFTLTKEGCRSDTLRPEYVEHFLDLALPGKKETAMKYYLWILLSLILLASLAGDQKIDERAKEARRRSKKGCKGKQMYEGMQKGQKVQKQVEKNQESPAILIARTLYFRGVISKRRSIRGGIAQG